MINVDLKDHFEAKSGTAPDTTPPSVGGGGTLSYSNITSSGYTLNWTKGTDNVSDPANLRYLVYQSDSNNIGTVQDAEANGTLLNPNQQDQLDIAQYVISLPASTTKWHQVILIDEDGNKAAYTQNSETTAAAGSDGLDSRAGDEATLEALNSTLTGLGTGWSSNMSLSNSIDGVTVETINSELRVTAIDLKNSGIGGNIEIDNWNNLKQCGLIALYLNNINSTIPQSLMDLANNNLEYLYLCMSDSIDTEIRTSYPHEAINTGGGQIHIGKDKGNEQNVFTGTVPAPSNPAASKLKWIAVNWTDSAEGAEDGIDTVDPDIFLGTSYEGIHFYENWNIGASGNYVDFPDLRGCTNLSHIQIGGGSGTDFDEDRNGWLQGEIGNKLDGLANLYSIDFTQQGRLILDFNDIDWRENVELSNFDISGLQMLGTPPAWFFDGTLPNLFALVWDWPNAGTGFSGQLPEFNTAQSLQEFTVAGHNFSGVIPASLFDNNPALVNTQFGWNNFESIGTDDLSEMSGAGIGFKLRQLRFYFNNISGRIPSLPWEEPNNNLADFTRFYINDNKFNFEDLLWIPSIQNPQNKPCFELYADHWDDPSSPFKLGFTYGNQIVGDPNGYSRGIGTTLSINDFETAFTHADNIYQWQKSTNGGSSWSDVQNSAGSISGATQKTLDFLDLQQSDEGTYRLEVTNTTFDQIIANSSLTGLTIYSEQITLTIT